MEFDAAGLVVFMAGACDASAAVFGICEAGLAADGLNFPPGAEALTTPGPLKAPGLAVAATAGAPWLLA
jgi:hypothetical protein